MCEHDFAMYVLVGWIAVKALESAGLPLPRSMIQFKSRGAVLAFLTAEAMLFITGQAVAASVLLNGVNNAIAPMPHVATPVAPALGAMSAPHPAGLSTPNIAAPPVPHIGVGSVPLWRSSNNPRIAVPELRDRVSPIGGARSKSPRAAANAHSAVSTEPNIASPQWSGSNEHHKRRFTRRAKLFPLLSSCPGQRTRRTQANCTIPDLGTGG